MKPVNYNPCKKQILTFKVALATLSFFFPMSSSNATPLNDNAHAYAQQDYIGTNYGGSISSTNGQEDLILGATTSPTGSKNAPLSINKEMWVVLDKTTGQQQWIEIGDKKGDVLPNIKASLGSPEINWSGHFLAYNYFIDATSSSSFHATPVGSKNPKGTHSFDIHFDSNKQAWVAFIDGKQITRDNDGNLIQFPAPFPKSSVQINVGIESKDDANSFKSGTYFSQWKYLDPSSGKWLLVNSPPGATDPTVLSGDQNTYNGMVSQYCPIYATWQDYWIYLTPTDNRVFLLHSPDTTSSHPCPGIPIPTSGSPPPPMPL